ncbi:MAG: GxxExxY protein [Parcubacteria group bacterium]|nr:GxxExxY protein [Parcubacteria group bacterium]
MAEIIHKELSFEINGLLFNTHNELGRFCREKQYADFFEGLLKRTGIRYIREKALSVNGVQNVYTNKVDFVIEDKILIDFKAKPLVTKEDYYQINRYLEASGLKLGLIVNFRNRYLKPIRVIRANS